MNNNYDWLRKPKVKRHFVRITQYMYCGFQNYVCVFLEGDSSLSLYVLGPSISLPLHSSKPIEPNFFCLFNWNTLLELEYINTVFNLPYTTHTRFLQAFTCTPHSKEQVFIRFYKMVRTMMKSYNHRMSFLARYMSQDARSITGTNWRIIARHYNIDISDIKCDKQKMYVYTTD